MTCTEKRSCRLCGKSALVPALTLTPTPPANAFLAEPKLQECHPLEVRVCSSCGHSQLGHVVDASTLFHDYSYVSGTSASFRDHFARYAVEVSASAKLKPNDLVVELGANDNTLLKCFPDMRRIGVEPAANLAKQCAAPGITTLNDFFTKSLALGIHENHGPAKLILANNVMAHIDDLDSVLEGVKALLADDGLFVFEVQYLGALLDGGMFDMCYHEHLDFHAVTPLLPFLARHGLDLLDVEKVPTHGGSIRCFASPRTAAHTDRLADLIAYETSSGILTAAPWKALRERIDAQRTELHALLNVMKGKSIVGYGAPAKMATFCYEMQLDARTLDYVCDDSPLKQGTYSPGLHIPILPPSALYEGNTAWPHAVVILAWNFAPQIIAAHKRLRDENGTHFITPFPRLEATP